MNSKQLKTFKIILFIAGLAVIAAAFAVVNLPLLEEGLSDNKKFFWISLAFSYLVFYIPLFLTPVNVKNVDSKIYPPFTLWLSLLSFAALAIILSILVLCGIMRIKTAVLADVIVLFICAVIAYFPFLAGSHIEKTAERENSLKASLSEIKSSFELLGMKADEWENSSETKARIKKLCDDARYISPVDSEKAFALENEISKKADELSKTLSDSMEASALNQKVGEIEILVKQRKLLKN